MHTAETPRGSVSARTQVLNSAVKPVLIGGARMRPADVQAGFKAVADASKYAVAVMPDAKGFFPDTHPHMMGAYW